MNVSMGQLVVDSVMSLVRNCARSKAHQFGRD